MKLRAPFLAIVLALGCVHSAHAQTKSESGAVDPATREKSRAAFRRGVTQLRGQDYNSARNSFEEAYSLVQHPSILLNLGITRLKTGDPVLAESDLQRFLQEDTGAAPDELASARESLAEARKQIGTLKLTVKPASAHVNVDGNEVTLKEGVGQTRLKGGSHTVVVEADGFTSAEKTADIPAKGEAKLDIELTAKAGTPVTPPKPNPEKPPATGEGSSMRPIAGYALAGVSGVALIVTAVLGVKALGASSDYSNKGSPGYQKAATKDDGVAARTGADVALVVALLAGAGAIILLFTDIGASHDPAPSTPAKANAKQRWLGPVRIGIEPGSPAIIRW